MMLNIVLSLCIICMPLMCISVGWIWYRRRVKRVFVQSFIVYIPAIAEMVMGMAYISGANLPDAIVAWCENTSYYHLIYPLGLMFHCVGSIAYEVKLHFNDITRSSIQTAVNEMDSGLMYVLPNGVIVLINRRMTRLSLEMFGKYQTDGNDFWTRLISFSQNEKCKRIDFTQWPAFLFNDGSVWSFGRQLMQDTDRTYYEIVAKDVTALYRKREDIAEETKKLKTVQNELNRIMRSISETGNDEELLNYKIRIHDQLGNAILRTRKALRDSNLQKQNIEEILYVWENTVKAFKQNLSESKPGEDGNFDEVFAQAKALGIELVVIGNLPENNPLCVRAVRESMYNSIRHAYANTIIVESYHSEGGFHVRIRDDGQVRAEKITEGGGLSSLRKAVEEIGGSMTVSVWEGVELSFFFPDRTENRGVM